MKRICALAMLALLLGMLGAGGPAGVYADGAEAVSSVSAGSSADPLQTGTPFADQTAAASPTSGERGNIIRLSHCRSKRSVDDGQYSGRFIKHGNGRSC